MKSSLFLVLLLVLALCQPVLANQVTEEDVPVEQVSDDNSDHHRSEIDELFDNIVKLSWGLPLAFLAVSLASAGGIGGGGVLVPLYILCLGFSPKVAIPLSKCTIFGGAVSNCFFYLQRKHPSSQVDRPAIDFDVLRILEPTTLMGTTAGVILNIVLPTWLVVGLLILFLAYTTKRTVKKGLKLYRKESAEKGNDLTAALDPSGDRKGEMKGAGLTQHESEPLLDTFRRWKLIEEEKDRFPLGKVAVVCVMWLCLVASSATAKMKYYPCGTPGYWLILFSAAPILVVIVLFVSRSLQRKHDAQVEVKYSFLETDVHWTLENSLRYSSWCVLAGVAAGLLGIGGGMVKNPLMLEMGMDPQVAAATAAFMILFTASATTVQFYFFGTLEGEAVIVFTSIGLAGGLFGQTVLDYLLKKYKRASVIVFALALVIGLSTVLMGVAGVLEVLKDIKEGELGFTSICDPTKGL